MTEDLSCVRSPREHGYTLSGVTGEKLAREWQSHRQHSDTTAAPLRTTKSAAATQAPHPRATDAHPPTAADAQPPPLRSITSDTTSMAHQTPALLPTPGNEGDPLGVGVRVPVPGGGDPGGGAEAMPLRREILQRLSSMGGPSDAVRGRMRRISYL